MNLEFDIENVTLIEFGVGQDNNNNQAFSAIPVDSGVQTALREMAEQTWCAMQEDDDGPNQYEPSNKHSNIEHLYLKITDPMSSTMRKLHQAVNLPINVTALTDADDIYCYFARLTDNQQRKLTALRRASQFKGVIKSRNRLVRLLDDTLKIVPDTIFKLDNDFDLFIDDKNIHILRPSGFEFVSKLQQAILDAVPSNTAIIRKEMPFVDIDELELYATTHPRAARYLAAIRGQERMKNIDRTSLKNLCKNNGVDIYESEGKIFIAQGHEIGFLEILDRRRYEIKLVKGKREKYRAPNRKAVR